MESIYTVDASVFLNAFNPAEAGHADSRALLEKLQRAQTPIIVPTLLLPEVAAAIRRGRRNEALAKQFAATLRRLPHLVFIPLDDNLAARSADTAAAYRLRGSDAVYVALAMRFGAALITLDKEQHNRAKPNLQSYYPVELLSTLLL